MDNTEDSVMDHKKYTNKNTDVYTEHVLGTESDGEGGGFRLSRHQRVGDLAGGHCSAQRDTIVLLRETQLFCSER